MNFAIKVISVLVFCFCVVNSCLITNCPRGGKRNGSDHVKSPSEYIKQCLPCGPQKSGQCFGPSICCGPFGCLVGTVETVRCERDGAFQERDPCIAGHSNCRGDTGRCATDGICCTQESCHTDPACAFSDDRREKNRDGRVASIDSLFNMLGRYQPNYPSATIIENK